MREAEQPGPWIPGPERTGAGRGGPARRDPDGDEHGGTTMDGPTGAPETPDAPAGWPAQARQSTSPCGTMNQASSRVPQARH
ncbi:hypothetical protein ACWC5G_35135, partial [Streptomyces sp. NPDC001274]